MKILFAGDFSVSYFDRILSIEEMYKCFEDVRPIFENTDYSMVNLECVLYDGDSEPIKKSGPNLRGHTSFINCLKYLGINVAGLANNHTGDYGDDAIFKTIDLLKENKIASIGAGKNIDEAYEPYIFEKDGLNVAVIAACENEFGVADSLNAGTAGFDLFKVSEVIKSAKKKADKVIFYFHGGNEHNPFPSPEKTKLYRYIAEIGADAVIAMHTHCPQGYEIYNGKPIVYSMGNFFFPYKPSDNKPKTSTWFFGYMTQLNITKKDITIDIIPYRFGGEDDPLVLLKGDEKIKFMDYLKEITEPISDNKKIERLFNIWCTIVGLQYAKFLKYSEDMENNGTKLCANLKNNFSCEAHNELLKNTLNLCYRNEIEKYKLLQDEILRYQNIIL